MTEAERLVREAWEWVAVEDHTPCCGSDDGVPWRCEVGDDFFEVWAPTEEAVWQAALDFTIARREEIRKADAAWKATTRIVDGAEDCIINFGESDDRRERLEIARWIRALVSKTRDDLKRGMREPASTKNPDAHLGAVEA